MKTIFCYILYNVIQCCLHIYIDTNFGCGSVEDRVQNIVARNNIEENNDKLHF